MSLRTKVVLPVVLAACVFVIVLVIGFYGLLAIPELVEGGASAQEVGDYCQMIRRVLLLTGAGGIWLAFVVACIVAYGLHRRLLMVVGSAVEIGEKLAYTAADDTEDLSELVSTQARTAMAVTDELVAILEGKSVRGRAHRDGSHLVDRPGTLSASDIVPLGDDDDF